MKLIILLAFSADLLGLYATAAPTASSNETIYPNGVIVKHYPNGLPPGLYPGTPDFEKRDAQTPPVVVNAPGVSDATNPRVGVYACSDANFSGRCVYIRTFPCQCVEPPIDPNANDATSSVGPDRPWKCRFYTQFRCDEEEGYFDLQYSGISDLSLTAFNDKISSFKCC